MTSERYNDRLRQGGVWVSGEGLDFSSNAKTVRVTDGSRTVTDGPYGSGKEQFAGLSIIEAESTDDAARWSRRTTGPSSGGRDEGRA